MSDIQEEKGSKEFTSLTLLLLPLLTAISTQPTQPTPTSTLLLTSTQPIIEGRLFTRLDCHRNRGIEDLLNTNVFFRGTFHVSGAHLVGYGLALAWSYWCEALGLE